VSCKVIELRLPFDAALRELVQSGPPRVTARRRNLVMP